MRIETDSQHYTDIAEAIRDMNGTENTYYPEEMASAILAIPQETYDVFAPIIYSLEEREVGVWTDGKPLYEITIHVNALPSTTYTLVSYPHGIVNIDKICDYQAIARWTTGETSHLDHLALPTASSTDIARSSIETTVDTTNIYIRCGYDRSSLSADYTIRYTKTTDVAGSGTWGTDGVPMVHYDGAERIIGTWFGETLYQKSFALTIPNTSGDYLFPNTAIPNWNFTVNVDWTVNGIGPRAATPWVTQYTMYLDEFSANGLYFYFQGTANAGLPLHVTVQYTKTSS